MIPAEAVEAALRAWAIRGGLSPEGIVRNILEAAAPHMLAQTSAGHQPLRDESWSRQ